MLPIKAKINIYIRCSFGYKFLGTRSGLPTSCGESLRNKEDTVEFDCGPACIEGSTQGNQGNAPGISTSLCTFACVTLFTLGKCFDAPDPAHLWSNIETFSLKIYDFMVKFEKEMILRLSVL